MRYIFILWATPLALFWAWYFLSVNDLNLGFLFLSREVHDLVFRHYGDILGIEPATIPLLLAKGCIIDTLLLTGIVAFRRRQVIGRWIGRYPWIARAAPGGGRAHPAG